MRSPKPITFTPAELELARSALRLYKARHLRPTEITRQAKPLEPPRQSRTPAQPLLNLHSRQRGRKQSFEETQFDRSQDVSKQKGPSFNRRKEREISQRQPAIEEQPIAKKFEEPKEFDKTQLVECSMGCGRKFKPEQLQKHETICLKVFQSKRKEFNSAEQRLEEVAPAKVKGKGKAKAQQGGSKKEDKASWKAKSQALRLAIRANKGEALTQVEEEQAKLTNQQANGLSQCRHCGRKFNEKAMKSHQPHCGNLAPQKRNMAKR